MRMLMRVRWQASRLGEDTPSLFQPISNWWWSRETVVIFCQEMPEPEPFSSALGRDRGAKMPRLVSVALQPIMNNSHQIKRRAEFCWQILKFQKIQSGKKICDKSQAWTKLFIKRVSLLSHKAEEFISLPKAPLATGVKKSMTSVTDSREASGHSSLLPSLVLLEYVSTYPGAVHFLHIHSNPMKHRRTEGTGFTEGKSFSETVLANNTAKIN